MSAFPGTGSASDAPASERKLEMYNIHTKENLSIVYKRDGAYIPKALDKINHFMRDWRRNEPTKMDPELIDLIWQLRRDLGSKKPVWLISGYRSSRTNEKLRRAGGGQAKRSQHILGKAADLHFPDVPVSRLRNDALIRERGGVGFYPTSAIPFVHVDTGRVRAWPRLPRQQLATLFPDGHTKHVPADGRRLTPKDGRLALARLKREGRSLPPAARLRLTLVKAKSIPQPLLASLAPASLDFGLRSKARGDAASAPTASPAPSKTGAAAIAAAWTNSKDSKGARAQADLASVASAPEYDGDHDDELYYQPFRLLPLMGDSGIASLDLARPAPDILARVHFFFAEPRGSLPLEFEPGLQYAGLYWASEFKGRAVSGILRQSSRKSRSPRRYRSAQAEAVRR